MDYKMLGESARPNLAVQHFSEQLVWLPHEHHFVSSLPATYDHPVSRDEYSLPEDAFVFCCFQGNTKIDPYVFEAWMRILERVPGSVLWLMGKTEVVRRNLRDSAARSGVDPKRLIFTDIVDIATHIARQTLADLFLDTYVYSGFTTVAMALWAGVPVVTCGGGKTLVAGLGASAVRAGGMGDLAVDGLDEFEERAVLLATHPEQLSELRNRVKECREVSPLFDLQRTIGYLEQAYRMMWQRCAAEEAPAGFTV
jgi:predicted O-linked N-acetylglucosamine transferase (SPINDLY family)